MKPVGGVNLGNLGQSLRLQCKDCGTRWPGATTMEAVQLHFQAGHDTGKVTLSLVPVCTCGAAMESTTAGHFKDYFRCPACTSTGFVKRDGQ